MGKGSGHSRSWLLVFGVLEGGAEATGDDRAVRWLDGTEAAASARLSLYAIPA